MAESNAVSGAKVLEGVNLAASWFKAQRGGLFIEGLHNHHTFSFCFSAARSRLEFGAPDQIMPTFWPKRQVQNRAAEKQKECFTGRFFYKQATPLEFHFV